LLSNDQKKLGIGASQKLMPMLGMYPEHCFKGIATGNESWFQYSSCSDSTFVDFRKSIVPKIRQDIYGQKTMITIVFASP
jgi:hypothetical protein